MIIDPKKVMKNIIGDKYSKPKLTDNMCDLCEQYKAVYDGKTKLGPWAYMCVRCFKKYGVGLGLGKGQILEDIEKKWEK